MLVALLMVWLVDVLLLFAAGRFLGSGVSPVRLMVGALLHTAFAGYSLLPSFSFLSHIGWRICALVVAGLAAYGLSIQSTSKVLLFCLLHLSIGGVVQSTEVTRAMLLGAAGIAFAGLAKGKGNDLVSVELSFGGQTVCLTALRDTGNALRDPITGRPVLVVEASVAQKLTGLSRHALQNPVESIGNLPGLRLIPYQTVGNSGFLLALRIPDVKIGKQRGSAIVAFSPQTLGKHYQALTGGTL